MATDTADDHYADSRIGTREMAMMCRLLITFVKVDQDLLGLEEKIDEFDSNVHNINILPSMSTNPRGNDFHTITLRSGKEIAEDERRTMIRMENELDHHASSVEGPEDIRTHEETDQIIETTIDQSPGLIEEPEQAVEWAKKLWELEEVPTNLEEEVAEECLTMGVMEKITEDDIGYSRPYKAKMSDTPEKTEQVVRSNVREIFSKGCIKTRHNTCQMQPVEESRHTMVSEQRVLSTEGDRLEPLPILPDPPDAEISDVGKHLRCKPSTLKDVTTVPIQETVEERKKHPADPPDAQPPQKKQKRLQKKKEWVQKRPGIRSPKDKSGHWRHKPPPDRRDEFLSFIEVNTEDPYLVT